MDTRFPRPAAVLAAALLVLSAATAGAGGRPQSAATGAGNAGTAGAAAAEAAPAGAMMAAAGAADQVFDLSGLEPAVVPFTTEAAARRLAAAGPTVYFFAANWCPTCRAAFRDIAAKFRDFPPGFSLVVVNYDTAKELKAAYAVVYQHTFVRIDADGRALKTWSGSPTVADIVAQAGGR